MYWSYGLKIESDFLLPELELVTVEDKPDIIIRKGIVPPTLEDAIEKGVRFEASTDKFLLKIDNIAKFYVTKGTEIIVQPYNGSDDADIRVFLLSSVFAALLDQRGCLVLHGACIEIDGKGILFTGFSGTGKSTLAAAFYKKGYRILADEICAINFSQTGIPIAIPSFPKLNIWKDAAEKLGLDISSLFPIRRKLKKYMLDVKEQFSKVPVPVSIIYLLTPDNNKELSITEIIDSYKTNIITYNAYRLRFKNAHGHNNSCLNHCVALAQNSRIYNLTYSSEKFELDELILHIEEEVKNLWPE